MQSWFHPAPYEKRYKFVPLSQISPDLQHAVIAAEDARFYQHHGFDWHQIQLAAEEDMEGERMRGASTLTQQLVKNLFFGTSRSIFRKAAEFTLVPVAEVVLGKRRILELYLNVVEWGPGSLWRGVGVPLLRPNLSAQYRTRAVGTTGGGFAGALEAASGTHDPLQRDHPESHAPDGLVIFVSSRARFAREGSHFAFQIRHCFR